MTWLPGWRLCQMPHFPNVASSMDFLWPHLEAKTLVCRRAMPHSATSAKDPLAVREKAPAAAPVILYSPNTWAKLHPCTRDPGFHCCTLTQAPMSSDLHIMTRQPRAQMHGKFGPAQLAQGPFAVLLTMCRGSGGGGHVSGITHPIKGNGRAYLRGCPSKGQI